MSSTQRRCVFVGNIPYDATEDQLIHICEEVGPVVSFRLVLDRETGKPKGYGFCEFKDEETALSARRNLQGYEINGRQLRVDFAENEKGSLDRNREQGRGGPGHVQNIDIPKQTGVLRAVRDSSFDQRTGQTAVASATLVMAGILGSSQTSAIMSQGSSGTNGQQNGGAIGGTASGNDALTNHLAGMSRHQLYEIVSQMKDLIQQNQQQARQILIANPQLTKALFQAQIMLGMVRPPQSSPLQNAAAQAPQQQSTQQSQVQSMQMPPAQLQQAQNLPELPAIQQTSVQQGLQQMPTGQFQSQLQAVQQSQALNAQLQPLQQSQNLQFQHSAQPLQQLNVRTNTMPSHSQSATLPTNNLGLQPQNPALQHAQLPLSLHLPPPPLPQQPRPLVSQSQLQPQGVQSMGFQLPLTSQSQLQQPLFQQPSGISQTNMGLPFQSMHPLLPNQPPPQQVFQMSRSGADSGGGTGFGQGGLPGNGGILTGAVSTGLVGPSQTGRGPSVGALSGSAPHNTWNQLLPSSGSMVGVPQSMTSMGIPVHIVPGHSLGGSGMGSSLAGGPPSNAAPPIQQGGIRPNVTGEGPGLIYAQGYNQPLTQAQPQQQLQQHPQVLLELEQQKALLQQLMNLTPEQIHSLPPEQRQQVLQLQQAFRSQTT